jgi:hypothetical protein
MRGTGDIFVVDDAAHEEYGGGGGGRGFKGFFTCDEFGKVTNVSILNGGVGYGWNVSVALCPAGSTWNYSQSCCYLPAGPPGQVKVTGVVGRKAEILNGVYQSTADLYNDKPLFRKLNDPGVLLRFNAYNKWSFGSYTSIPPEKNSNRTNDWCTSVEAGSDLPTHVGTWQIYGNGAEDQWEEYPPMKCIDAGNEHEYEIVIPHGSSPGSSFQVQVAGQTLAVICPDNLEPGMTMKVVLRSLENLLLPDELRDIARQYDPATGCFNLSQPNISVQTGKEGGVPGNFDECLEIATDVSSCRCGSGLEEVSVEEGGSGYVDGALEALFVAPDCCLQAGGCKEGYAVADAGGVTDAAATPLSHEQLLGQPLEIAALNGSHGGAAGNYTAPPWCSATGKHKPHTLVAEGPIH